VGVSGGVGMALSLSDGCLQCETSPPGQEASARDLLALDVDLAPLHSRWLAADPSLAPILRRWRGLRVMRQQPAEALFSFICSACNTVGKIERSMAALRRRWGVPLGALDGLPLHGFPEIADIAALSPGDLRADLWGYRAEYAVATARGLLDRGDGWLASLAHAGLPEARAELMRLPGVGRKVADCVLLFGLRYDEATPIDVHVAREVGARYLPQALGRALSRCVYDDLSQALRDRFGVRAGWVQQYLFVDALSRGRAVPPWLCSNHREDDADVAL
jgi:N-glycosylase/DNA lyase